LIEVVPRRFSHPADDELGIRGALRTLRIHVRRAICAVGGHDYLVHADSRRIFLQCADCGQETPGWQINPRISSTDRAA